MTTANENTQGKMNYIYLMMDEKKNHCLFKVGFAKNLRKRIKSYTTHNPECKCISYAKTMRKTGRTIEQQFHNEIEQKKYSFVYAWIDWKKTEWFRVSYKDPFYKELKAKGIKAFKCGENRTDLGEYRVRKPQMEK